MSLRCYVGLGSNQAEPAKQLQLACKALDGLPETRLLSCSQLYRSKPMGPQDQPDYLNAVALIETSLAPLLLLDKLQQIEQQQGRERKAERWGPRSLDLDMLLYANQQIDTDRLRVPHYHMHARPFVLYPLAELEPDLIMPDGTPLQHLLKKCPPLGIEALADMPAQG
ncbi:2-amino-4-hydroxy-6-hydroxymethyldihydropteridine diphosphokinase [Halopseudomonas salina]|uniref:2-amino-4-hydroxy-6-hydroxymethyldihydropteridine pyrophosphokinase n=1 Tax=Halopseudomonas salina TaxID=1323744 RepID=A0ABQ1PZ23_9GAMM|nr:2-amino-4-hydroxy-6-hydroxymethyldihydropteridine diphosphokinase [Halopseudomonas salina]GGD08052.1 2-amino-4-hydroxy-6-hydroxymethyldihydropteridine diphosphokinase [Halopseudomonas salina]